MKRLKLTGKVTKNARQCSYCKSTTHVTYCFWEGRDLCEGCAAVWNFDNGVKHENKRAD